MRDLEEIFRTYRRNLPHFRARGYLYFVTWRLHTLQSDLEPDERTVIVEALRWFEGSRYDLWGFVVMNDHVHVLVLPEDDCTLETILHSWKSFTAHRLRQISSRIGPIWQEESFDRIVRNERELHEKMEYVRNNPLDRWPDRKYYPWVWCKGSEKSTQPPDHASRQ
jgi:putative transposase